MAFPVVNPAPGNGQYSSRVPPPFGETQNFTLDYVLDHIASTLGTSEAGVQFPSSKDIERIQKGMAWEKIWEGDFYDEGTKKGIFKLKKYFERDKDKKAVLAIVVNAPKMLFKKTTRFFIGKKVQFIAKSAKNEKTLPDLQKKLDVIVDRNSYREVIRSSSLAMQIHGYTTNEVSKEVNEAGKAVATIHEIAYCNTFPLFDFQGKKIGHVIGKYIFIQQKQKELPNKVYFYAKKFYMDHGKAAVEHKLYETNGYYLQKEVRLSTLGPDYAELEKSPVQLADELDHIPIEQANEMKIGSKHFGESCMKDIQSLAEELTDSLTRIITQFVKHSAAKMAIPRSAVPKEIDPISGELVIKSSDIEVFLMDEGEPMPQYVVNSNPLIEQEFTGIKNILSLIAAATESPRQFFGGILDDSGGNEKVQTVKIRIAEFLRKIEDYQDTLGEMAERTLITALQMEGEKLPEDFDIETKFRDGLPMEKSETVDTYAKAIDSSLMSREKAVSEFQQIEGDELTAELKKIDDEKTNDPLFNFQSITDKLKKNPTPPVPPNPPAPGGAGNPAA